MLWVSKQRTVCFNLPSLQGRIKGEPVSSTAKQKKIKSLTTQLSVLVWQGRKDLVLVAVIYLFISNYFIFKLRMLGKTVSAFSFCWRCCVLHSVEEVKLGTDSQESHECCNFSQTHLFFFSSNMFKITTITAVPLHSLSFTVGLKFY